MLAQCSFASDLDLFWFGLEDALTGKDHFDLAGANTKGNGSKGTVGGGVAIAADDGHAGLGDSELRSDDVHDAMPFVAQTVHGDFVPLTIGGEGLNLLAGEFLADWQVLLDGRHVVVGCCHCILRTEDGQSAVFQSRKCYRTGNLGDEMSVVLKHKGACFVLNQHMGIPDLVK